MSDVAEEQDSEVTTDDVETDVVEQQGQDPSAQPTDFDSLPEWAKKELRRARNDAAKARTKARDAEKANLSDADKIRAEVREEVAREYAGKLAATELRGALSELKDDVVDDLIEDLNLTNFIDEDGEVDKVKVRTFANRILGSRRSRVEPGAGSNGSSAGRNASDDFARVVAPLFK
jgi:hypothetical protein